VKPTVGIFALGTIGLSACMPSASERCTDAVPPHVQTRALASIATEIPVDFGERYQEPILLQCGDLVKVSYFLRDVDGLAWVGGDVNYYVSLADGTIVKTELSE